MASEIYIKPEPCPESPDASAGIEHSSNEAESGMETEFVNIKIEPTITISIKQEPPDYLDCPIKHEPPKYVENEQTNILNPTEQIDVQVSGPPENIIIKVEPADPDDVTYVSQDHVAGRMSLRFSTGLLGNSNELEYAAQFHAPCCRCLQYCQHVEPTAASGPPVLPVQIASRPKTPQTILPDLSDTDFALAAQSTNLNGSFHCPICNKKFVNRGNVLRHMPIHNREVYKCEFCTKEYTNKAFYDKHMYMHSLEKKYQCEKCMKRFRTTSNLEQHKKSHLEVKPFVCDICERPFSIRGNMLKHKQRHNCKKPNTDPITCNICNKVFEKEYLLKVTCSVTLRKSRSTATYVCTILNIKAL
ncbi:hypothetical protein MSG28_015283 [Choristoneura fumiferana]|uniref:Uncharacterized protein n=1 Tax=Choristoneura fumiferana TaxID=7141 RepID=A0ACC0KAK2_CHOFU|nr:hypothetical protein MSG28_015283 [Choristoneura fumiferana]